MFTHTQYYLHVCNFKKDIILLQYFVTCVKRYFFFLLKNQTVLILVAKPRVTKLC